MKYSVGSGPIHILVDDTRAEKKFARIAGKFAKLDVVLRGPVREIIREALEQQFDTEGEYGGTPWEDLAASTQHDRRYSRYNIAENHPILERSGRLRRALTKRGASGAFTEVGKNYLVVGTKGIPYAKAHQRGSDHSNLPARTIVPDSDNGQGRFPPSFYRKLRSVVSGYLIGAELE